MLRETVMNRCRNRAKMMILNYLLRQPSSTKRTKKKRRTERESKKSRKKHKPELRQRLRPPLLRLIDSPNLNKREPEKNWRKRSSKRLRLLPRLLQLPISRDKKKKRRE